jgi:outer membrane lipoprotein SlyB
MPGYDEAPREISRQSNAAGFALKKTHPAIIVAAGAVTIFCAVGIGVMTGLIPSARAVNGNNASTSAPLNVSALPAASMAQAPLGNASEAAIPQRPESEKPAPVLKPIDKPHLGQPLSKGEPTNTASAAKKPVSTPTPSYQVNPSTSPSSTAERGVTVAANAPVTATNSTAYIPTEKPAAPIVCNNCGTVESVLPVSEQGQGSGAGAVIGGVIGGVLGRQVGNGRGKDVATVAGAVGGAVLGNQIEKSNKTTQHVNIRIRLDDGTFQTIRSETDQGMRIGDKVKIENGRLVRNS